MLKNVFEYSEFGLSEFYLTEKNLSNQSQKKYDFDYDFFLKFWAKSRNQNSWSSTQTALGPPLKNIVSKGLKQPLKKCLKMPEKLGEMPEK